MKHKTELRKGLGLIRLSASVAPGTALTSDGKPAGTVHSVVGDRAIAYLRYDRAEKDLMAGDTPVEWLREPL